MRNIYFRQGGGQSIVPDRDGQPIVRLDIDAAAFNRRNGGTILDSGVPLLVFDESIQVRAFFATDDRRRQRRPRRTDGARALVGFLFPLLQLTTCRISRCFVPRQMTFLSEWKKMVGTDFTFGKMLITESDVKAFPTLIVQIKVRTRGRRAAVAAARRGGAGACCRRRPPPELSPAAVAAHARPTLERHRPRPSTRPSIPARCPTWYVVNVDTPPRRPSCLDLKLADPVLCLETRRGTSVSERRMGATSSRNAFFVDGRTPSDGRVEKPDAWQCRLSLENAFH